jgi:hypothetical protein
MLQNAYMTFKLFGYSIFWLLEYLMKVITETYRLYYISYQRSYCDPFEQSIHDQDNAMFFYSNRSYHYDI